MLFSLFQASWFSILGFLAIYIYVFPTYLEFLELFSVETPRRHHDSLLPWKDGEGYSVPKRHSHRNEALTQQTLQRQN
jgi:hypothetical protein